LLAKRLKYRSEYKRRWNEAIENLVAAKILKPGSTYTIPIDVQTRWNSTFHCLQAISNAQDVLKEFYSLLPSKQISGEEKLVAADLGLINEMIPILKVCLEKGYDKCRDIIWELTVVFFSFFTSVPRDSLRVLRPTSRTNQSLESFR
jgi:hypothetical protein